MPKELDPPFDAPEDEPELSAPAEEEPPVELLSAEELALLRRASSLAGAEPSPEDQAPVQSAAEPGTELEPETEPEAEAEPPLEEPPVQLLSEPLPEASDQDQPATLDDAAPPPPEDAPAAAPPSEDAPATPADFDDEPTPAADLDDEPTPAAQSDAEPTPAADLDDQATAVVDFDDQPTALVDFDDEPTALIPAEDKPTVRISVEDRVGEPKSAPPAPIPPRRVSVAETSQAEETADLATRPEPPTGEQPPISQEDPTRNDTKPLPISKRERRRLSRKRRRAWIPVLVAVVVLVAGYVGAALYFADRVPKGAQVAGIEIGGLEKSQAIDKLTAGLAAAAKEPIEVSIGEAETTLDPVLAGMSFSAEQSVAAVTGLSFDPRRLWDQVSGIGNVALVTTVDRAALETELGRLAAETATEGQNGTVSVAGGTVEVTDPQPGVLLDQTAALAEVTVKYLVTPGPWALPVVEQEPKIGAEALSAAVSELAEPILTGGVRVQVGTNSVEIPAADLAAAALIAPAGPEATSLTLSWDQELLTAAVTSRLPAGVLSDARDARFEFVDGQPQIVDGQAGVTLDVPAMVESINSAALATAEARQAEAPLIEIDPEAGRAELEQLGIVEVVGRFETQATADYNRNQNLRKASDIVTGVLVKPGETFSLDKALGHRSKETGWFDAGVVVAGVSQDGIGGGLSQFSTTLYNAGHLAGMVDVTHTPHSNYFSRYPRGREATIWEGQIDNQFKNDTPYGVLLRAGLTSDLRLWVELWSTKYWTVEAEIGQPYSFTSPKTIDSTAADCKPQSAGGSGFQVDYWRIKTDPNGNAQAKETWHWRYEPMNAIVCKRR